MERPDLDRLLTLLETGSLPAHHAAHLIAYARHLEAKWDETHILGPDEMEGLILGIEKLQARISELEAALEPFEQAHYREGTIRNLPGGAYENAARVLRKGAQHGE